MLEGLDRVDWAKLGHAYGQAEDVPGQIRALSSADAETREKALHDLYGNIFHQGTRYEATAYAVPFLLELLADPGQPGRPELLGLLSAIAIGYDETWLPSTFPIAEHRESAEGGAALLAAAPRGGSVELEDDGVDEGEDVDEDELFYEYIEQLSEEETDRLFAHFAVAAYDAVRAGVPLCLSLLGNPDPELRAIAAYTLAWYPEDVSLILPALASSNFDSDFAAATALAAIGLVGGSPDAASLRDPRPLVRWGAAIGLARAQGAEAPQEVVDELLSWLAPDNVSIDRRVPFLNGDLGGYAGLALGQVGAQFADVAFDALLARIPVVSGVEALPIVGEALRRAFPDGPLAEDIPFVALSELQQSLARMLAHSPSTWLLNGGSTFGNFSQLVRYYGLPVPCDELRAYIA